MSDLPDLGDLDPEEFRRRGHQVIDWICDYLTNTRDYPVLSKARPGQILAQLPATGPEEPVSWDETLAAIDDVLVPGMTHWNHPGFFAYFANTGSAPGILGAALATALNPNGMLWRTSPAVTELEQRVLEWVRDWLGLPAECFGIIYDTASTSSLCALAAARQAADGYCRERGVAALDGRLRLYRSEQAHSSIDKAALVLGLGLDSVRAVPTRDDYSMDPAALAETIEADRNAGLLPFCVVATAGTTSSTSIDPLADIASVCERHRLWMHVDAAYGGAAAMVPETRSLFAGWERAQSVVVNPHKWLYTPMSCSLLYTTRPDTLREAFSLVPEYLRSDVGEPPRGASDNADTAPPDLMNFGIQLGRPFRALKLWMVLNAYGRRGIVDRLRAQLAMAADLARRIDEHPDFERLAATPLGTVCFRCRPGAGSSPSDGTTLPEIDHDPHAELNEQLMTRVNDGGAMFISHTRLRGRLVLRMSIGNLRTTRDDLDLAWKTLQRAATELLSA